jgi:hypothetical protein
MRILGEILRFNDRFDDPRPFDRTKTLIDRGRENGFWPATARDTNCAHGAHVCFPGDNVMSRTHRPGDHRTIALLAWKGRQMEIMRGCFQWAHECAFPCHWRHRPVGNNRIIAQLGYLGHWGLLLCAALRHPCGPPGLGAGPRGGSRRRVETPYCNQYGICRRRILTPIAHTTIFRQSPLSIFGQYFSR